MYKYKILLVDDEMMFLQIISEILALKLAFEHTVITAKNVPDAWEKILKNQLDLVITDFSMPGGNGLELCGKIKAKYPQLPVILQTGNLLLPNCALGSAPDKVLHKPYSPKELVSAIMSFYHE